MTAERRARHLLPVVRGLERLEAGVGAIAGGAAAAAGWLFLFTAFFVTFDVVGRRFFGVSSQGTSEIAGYVNAVTMSWAFAHALRWKRHVRVDVFLIRFSKPVQGYLNFIALLFLEIFTVVMLWQMWDLAIYSVRHASAAPTVLRTPLGIPQTLWALGFSLLAVLGFIMLLHAGLELVAGRARNVAVTLGPRTVEDEIRQDIPGGS